MIRRPFSFSTYASRNTGAAAWILALTMLLSGYSRTAQEINALPPDPDLWFVEIHLLTMDARTDRPVVWMDRGASQGVHRGDRFHVFHNGAPAGTLTVDAVLHSTSSGTLSRVTDYAGPLYDAAFEVRKLAPPGETQLLAEFVFSPRMDSALSLNGIRAPRRGSGIMSQPWRKEYDTDLDTLFRSIAASGPVSIKAPPPPPVTGPLPLASASALPAPDPEPAHQAGFRLRELDPDIARDIKSVFFLVSGDCIHIAPWPDRSDGFFMEISEDQTLILPGPRFVSTDGKSLLRLEKEIGAFPAFQSSPVRITPCVRTDTPAPGAHPR